MNFLSYIALGAAQGTIRLAQVPKWAYCKLAGKSFEWFSFNIQ